jgi:hypothetical protein
MNGPHPHAAPPPTAAIPPPLAAGWYADPLDTRLRRYFDGTRWTFWTAHPSPADTTPASGTSSSAAAAPAAATPSIPKPPPTPSQQGLRPDIAAAKKQAKLTLGAEKEIRLLETRLQTEETVLALCGATGEGMGVLACTNRRLLFFFSGLIRNQFLEVDWNAARHVIYDERSKRFMVYTVKLTKRAVPAMTVTIANRDDAVRVARAAEAASAAPRLDIA